MIIVCTRGIFFVNLYSDIGLKGIKVGLKVVQKSNLYFSCVHVTKFNWYSGAYGKIKHGFLINVPLRGADQ